MVRIRVRYFGHLHELAGRREEYIAIDDEANLSDLISEIAKRHGKKFEDHVFDNHERLKDGFVCAVNGNTIGRDEFSVSRCGKVKEFAILPPISGGI